MISCANKILSRSNNIFSRRNKLKNKTHMSRPGFRTIFQIILFTDTKVCLYVGNISLNRKDEKKYVEVQKVVFV